MTAAHVRRHKRVLREMATDYLHRATGFANSVERRHLAARAYERHGALLYALQLAKPAAWWIWCIACALVAIQIFVAWAVGMEVHEFWRMP